jgi:hypothetical protein
MTDRYSIELDLEQAAGTVRLAFQDFDDATFKLTNASRTHIAELLWWSEKFQQTDTVRRTGIDWDTYSRAFHCPDCDGTPHQKPVWHCGRCGWHSLPEQAVCGWCSQPK